MKRAILLSVLLALLLPLCALAQGQNTEMDQIYKDLCAGLLTEDDVGLMQREGKLPLDFWELYECPQRHPWHINERTKPTKTEAPKASTDTESALSTEAVITSAVTTDADASPSSSSLPIGAEATVIPAADADITSAPVADLPATGGSTTDPSTTDAHDTVAPATNAEIDQSGGLNNAPATDGGAVSPCAEASPAPPASLSPAPIDAEAMDTPVSDTPITGAPITEAPTADAPVAGAPVTVLPATDAPVAGAHTADAPTADVPVTVLPSTDAPVTDLLTADTPVAGAPTAAPTDQNNNHSSIDDIADETAPNAAASPAPSPADALTDQNNNTSSSIEDIDDDTSTPAADAPPNQSNPTSSSIEDIADEATPGEEASPAPPATLSPAPIDAEAMDTPTSGAPIVGAPVTDAPIGENSAATNPDEASTEAIDPSKEADTNAGSSSSLDFVLDKENTAAWDEKLQINFSEPPTLCYEIDETNQTVIPLPLEHTTVELYATNLSDVATLPLRLFTDAYEKTDLYGGFSVTFEPIVADGFTIDPGEQKPLGFLHYRQLAAQPLTQTADNQSLRFSLKLQPFQSDSQAQGNP